MGIFPERGREAQCMSLETTEKDLQYQISQENNKQIVVQNLPRKVIVNANPIGWSLFGHILRETKTPSQIKQQQIIIIRGNKLRGRPKTTLPMVFNRDLALIQYQK